jgi:threonine 3-dehydrogenase
MVDVRPLNIRRETLPKVMAELHMQEGFDIGLEMSGSPAAFDEMVEVMIMGGNIALLGIPAEKALVDWSKIIFKALTIKAIYGREMFETWYKMLAILNSGLDLHPIITHHFAVEQFEEGFKAMQSGEAGKVILKWD